MNSIEELDSYQASVMREIPVKKHLKGPAYTSFTEIKADSVSTSGANFSIQVPQGSIMDKRIWLHFPLQFYTSGAGAADISAGAPRDFPVNSMIQVASLNFGGNTLTSRPSELVYGLVKYAGYPEYLAGNYQTPTQQDLFQDLSLAPSNIAYRIRDTAANALTDTAAYPATEAYVHLRNPQSPFLKTTLHCGNEVDLPRGAFPRGGGNGNTKANAITQTFTEPLLHGALADAGDMVAIGQLGSKITLNLIFYNDAFNRCWSFPGAAVTGGAVEMVDNEKPSIWVRFITPSVEEIPAVVHTNYKEYVVQSQTVAAFAANTPREIIFNNFSLPVVPTTFYLFARPTTPTTREGRCYLLPQKLNVTCGAKQNLLANLDEDMLYSMSVDNGLKQMNYALSKRIGYPVCIDVAKDLNFAAGMQTPLNFSFKATFVNPTGASYTADPWDVYMIAVLDGHLEITPGRVNTIIGYNDEDIMNFTMDQDEAVVTTETIPDSGTGSGFNRHAGNGSFKNFLKTVKTAAKYVVPGLNIAAQLSGKDKDPRVAAALGGLNVGNKLIGNGFGAPSTASFETDMRGRRTLGYGKMLG